MTELSLMNGGSPLMMTSGEIAELLGKEKKAIHREIKEQLFINLYGKDGADLHHERIQGLTIILDERGYWKEVQLDRYHADILVSGYEVKYRAAIVKRWYELENAVKPVPVQATSPLTLPKAVVADWLDLHNLFGTPLHLAQIESVKATEVMTGVDLSVLLLNAPAQQDIQNDEVMLEPKELAIRLGFKSAIALNKKLIELGLQSRINGELVATDESLGMFTKHAWKNRGKSGYNYKWNLGFIKSKLG